MNRLLRSNFAHVIYDTHKPKHLLQGIHERFMQIEAFARQKYKNLDAGVDSRPSTSAEAAVHAASIAIFVVLGPTLTAMFGFMGTLVAGVISMMGGVVGYMVIGIIEAGEKYHKLEEAIKV
ncbi:hypothetical protein Aspvir_003316 [Aspergillus viridinutans]|uniref:Uncharacterized protein n=1 Tax=Aspergillus viridinutans TaxID=75553 RepID=A0A9P3C4F9_ASPVI|nr:uncharacterized protein Aspvir_003316 [Aspergillus viridinutans]GIK07650.1 hypothetical protein Aspvir_003316 [Aspergillus viridinutans]